uniref:Uncharacterized protein n=1 Tax=Octopus bimaculoides TaxID=37653 RepID=A0A0L8FQB0_OCTBM
MINIFHGFDINQTATTTIFAVFSSKQLLYPHRHTTVISLAPISCYCSIFFLIDNHNSCFDRIFKAYFVTILIRFL